MQKEHIVIKPDTALALKNAGLSEPALFSYFATGDALQLEPTAANGLSFVAAAYTATELMDILPGGLEVDRNTWVAGERCWKHPAKSELTYPHAHLHTVKTPGGAYIAAYYHFSRNIAFRKTDDGKFANLIFIEESPAESLAQMVLALKEAGKLIMPSPH